MTELKSIDGVPKLLHSIRSYKGHITQALNKLKASDSLNKNIFNCQESLINGWLSKIEIINSEIDTLCSDKNLDISSLLKIETDYIIDINNELAYIEEGLDQNIANNSLNVSQISNSNVDALANAIASFQANSLIPKVQCSKFSGKTTSRFEYKNFLIQFKNCTSNMTSDSAKLTYLRTCLTDFALQIISHLSITNENYQIALDLLNNEYLDEEYIVDEIFKMLVEVSPKNDHEFNDLKKYLIKTRADLYEFNNSFNVDLITVNTAGNKLVSHLIYSKLLNIVRRELVRISNTNYPNTEQIFDLCPNIMKTLIKTSYRKYENNITNNVSKNFYRI